MNHQDKINVYESSLFVTDTAVATEGWTWCSWFPSCLGEIIYRM